MVTAVALCKRLLNGSRPGSSGVARDEGREVEVDIDERQDRIVVDRHPADALGKVLKLEQVVACARKHKAKGHARTRVHAHTRRQRKPVWGETLAISTRSKGRGDVDTRMKGKHVYV